MTHDPSGLPDLPGRYKRDGCSPGSLREREGHLVAGWPMTMLRLRFCGVYMPLRKLHKVHRATGLLLTTNEFGEDRVNIIDPGGSGNTLTRGMIRVEMLRARQDGSMLLQGVEWDEGELRQWPQTWLCCPDSAGIDPALELMGSWLDRQYASAKAAIERPTKRWPYV